MREIEFRGKALISIEELDEIGIKHKNGYVYGDLADNSHIVTGILESNDEYICSETWCGIDSKTIGQYTGLKDKNGKKIFEGDIVAFSEDDFHVFNSQVEYFSEDGYPAFDIKVPSDYYFDSNVFSEVSMSGLHEIEVIGNIHENLELLEVSE
ncbi:YopX family protein [Listeria monocytogenes]